MSFTEQQWKDYLTLYGATVEDWPDDIRAEALRAKHNPAFSGLMMQQQYYDEVLLNNRRFEPSSMALAERIIARARVARKRPALDFTQWLGALLEGIFPRPAFALASIVLMGFILGLSVPVQSGSDESDMGVYMDDEGATL